MYGEEYFKFVEHLKEEHEDSVLVVLKGHLLLEVALKEYISKRVASPERLDGVQINFSSLIYFASSLEDRNADRWLWSALRKANRLRNQLAHNLEPSGIEDLKSKFIDYVFSNSHEVAVEVNDRLLRYSKLAIAMLQVFDGLCSSYPKNKQFSAGTFKKTGEGRTGLMKIFSQNDTENA